VADLQQWLCWRLWATGSGAEAATEQGYPHQPGQLGPLHGVGLRAGVLCLPHDVTSAPATQQVSLQQRRCRTTISRPKHGLHLWVTGKPHPATPLQALELLAVSWTGICCTGRLWPGALRSLGYPYGSRHCAQAQKIRTRQTRHHLRVLEGVQFIASPTTFRTAPPIPRGATEGGHSDLVLVARLMQCGLPPAASPGHPLRARAVWDLQGPQCSQVQTLRRLVPKLCAGSPI